VQICEAAQTIPKRQSCELGLPGNPFEGVEPMNKRASTPAPRTTRHPAQRLVGEIEDSAVHNIGLRVNGLVSLVDNMSHSAYRADIAKANQACDFISELRVKLEAVRCMLQVVAHLSGAARANVLSTVTGSVQDLEEIVYDELQSRHFEVSARKTQAGFGA
jgi:hypothetical protein